MLARTPNALLNAVNSPLLLSAARAVLLLLRGERGAAMPQSGCPSASIAHRDSGSQVGRSYASLPELVPTATKQPATAVTLPKAAVFASPSPAADNAAGRDELPLWRHLREQEGFSKMTILRLQQKVKGTATAADKVQHNLAPNIAALRKEGLTTPNLERLYLSQPESLYTTHDTFTSSLPVVRGLADQLDSNKLRPYDPPLTRLGAAIRDYPGSAHLMRCGGSYITATQQFLQDELDVSSAEFAAAVFRSSAILFRDTARAHRMVKHLLDVYKGATKKVKTIALSSSALGLEPAKFDRLVAARAAYLGITTGAVFEVYLLQPSLAVRLADQGLDATVDVIARLSQAAAGMPADAPLQPEHLQAAKAMVSKTATLQATSADRVQGNWDYLRREGQADSLIWAAFRTMPPIMACHLEGTTQQLKAAWIKEHLDLGFADFIISYPGYTTYGVAKMAVRADFLKAYGHWDAILAQGIGPIFSVITMSAPNFANRLNRLGCTKEQLAAFERKWLRSPAGQRWGGKSDQSRWVEKNKAVV